MSEIEAMAPTGWIIQKRWLPVLFVAGAFGILCVGTTGIFAGSSLAERKWQHEKLEYEQRLGTQSASFAQQLSVCQNTLIPLVSGLKQTQQDVSSLSSKFDKASVKRDRASAEAIRASKDASDKADALSAQIARQQQVIVPKLEAAASAAQATEKKLDNATLPAAAVPAHAWGK